jgi:hypothetical protein
MYMGEIYGSLSGTDNISDIAVDWVLVRQYAASVPTSAFGSEENVPEMVILLIPIALAAPFIVRSIQRKRRLAYVLTANR